MTYLAVGREPASPRKRLIGASDRSYRPRQRATHACSKLFTLAIEWQRARQEPPADGLPDQAEAQTHRQINLEMEIAAYRL